MEIGPVEGALIRLASHLEALGLRWALVGGLAVSALSEPRTTGDVDVVVSVAGDAETEAALGNLQARGYQIHAALEHVAGRFSTMRMISPGRHRPRVLVDLLFASSGIEPEIASLAQSLEVVPGLEVPVARLGHLVALKVLAAKETRPRDYEDARQLLRVASVDDIHLARESLDLITRRGFDRDKDLQAVLSHLLQLVDEEA